MHTAPIIDYHSLNQHDARSDAPPAPDTPECKTDDIKTIALIILYSMTAVGACIAIPQFLQLTGELDTCIETHTPPAKAISVLLFAKLSQALTNATNEEEQAVSIATLGPFKLRK